MHEAQATRQNIIAIMIMRTKTAIKVVVIAALVIRISTTIILIT